MIDLSWRKSFATGIQVVDEQHKQLLQLAREAEALLEGGTPEQVTAELKALIDYTRYHFASEEQAMAIFCPQVLESHAAEHQRLTNLVLEMWDAREQNKLTPQELFGALCDWVLEHILQRDLVDLKPTVED